MNRLHLEVMETPGFMRRTTRLSGDYDFKPISVFHEFDRPMPLSARSLLDGHVLTVFHYAATLGKPLVVHGTLSRVALRNFEELALLFHRMHPHRYKRFDITPERVADVVPR